MKLKECREKRDIRPVAIQRVVAYVVVVDVDVVTGHYYYFVHNEMIMAIMAIMMIQRKRIPY